MMVGRVAGTVVSTINAPLFDGRKLLLCELEGGGYTIAVDQVGAGSGETVLIIDEGNSARQLLELPSGPVRTVVVGIVDEVTGLP